MYELKPSWPVGWDLKMWVELTQDLTAGEVLGEFNSYLEVSPKWPLTIVVHFFNLMWLLQRFSKQLPQRFMNLKWLLQRLSKQKPQRFINLNDTLNFNIWGTYTSPTLSINRAVVNSIALQTKYVFSKSHDISQNLRICIFVHGSCGWHQCALYHFTTKL